MCVCITLSELPSLPTLPAGVLAAQPSDEPAAFVQQGSAFGFKELEEDVVAYFLPPFAV